MQALAQALDAIDGLPMHELTVSKIVAHTSASRRTLEHSFRDQLGMSPAAYRKATRLKALNRDFLLAEAGSTSVRDICRQHGFIQLGQLAADYRRHFGELPSANLQRS